jgi:DNA-binding beta-propeller fold protein YncE
MFSPVCSAPTSMPARKFALALALIALLAAAPRNHARPTGTFKLSLPSGPIVADGRISIDQTGVSGPYSLSVLGPGAIDGHDFIAPQVASSTRSTIIGAARGAIAYGSITVVPPPAPQRSILAVASYEDGIALHDASTFALLGYVPIGGPPGDVAFAPDGSVLAPDTDGDTLTAVQRSPWKVRRISGVPLGNEIGVNVKSGAIFVTDRDAGGFGALTRVSRDGTVTHVKTGDTSEGLAIDSARGLVYVGNVNDTTVTVVDARTMRVVRRLRSVERTFGIALDSHAQRLYVVSNVSPTMNRTGGFVAAIDLRSGRITRRSPHMMFPLGVAFDAPHQRLFVSDEAKDQIYVIASSTLRPMHSPLQTCRTPWRPQIAGNVLYVPCARANRIDAFDLRTLHRLPGAPFATGGFPLSVALWP